MIDQLFGTKMPMSADTQKETFKMLIEDTLGEDGDYETVRNIHETLNQLIEEHKEEPEPLALDLTDMKKVFEQSGVEAEKMESFDRNFTENAGEKTSLLASNIAETRKFQIETPDIVIKVNPYGCLVTKAIHEKNTYKNYIGVDACAVNLMRPAMYGAYHHITVLGKEDEPCDHKYDDSCCFYLSLLFPVIPVIYSYCSCSNSFSHNAAHASLGILQSPRGERATLPTFGPSGRQERLNCCEKNLR